jgi:DNA-binding SARP family transcriptional activator
VTKAKPIAAAIEFRILGPVSLRDGDGREVGGLLAQPRRLALLAYLAAATPRGLQRRDVILTLFWPELDQEHARAALRQALRVIRGALGAVVVSRGDDEIGLDFGRVSCDVVSFESALAGGRLDEALDLYRGDLLEGFFISNAPEFEGWTEKQRARLRTVAAAGARRRAEELQAAGDLVSAVTTYRRALELAPHDEILVRRTIELLDRLGDRAGAAQLYETFERRLVADLGVEPAPETKARMAAVRGRQSASAPLEPAGPPIPQRQQAPATATAPLTPIPSRARAGRLAWPIGVAAAIALAALGVVTGARRHGGAALRSNRVLIASLDNRTGDTTLSALGQLAAEWIARSLAQTGLVEVADPASERLARGPAGGGEPTAPSPGAAEGARRLALESGSGLAVWGDYYRRGDSVELEAEVTDERRRTLMRSVGPVTGSVADPRPAIATLAQRVTGVLVTALDPKLRDWAGLASQPPSYEAYREFMAGVHAWYDQEAAREGLEHFDRAAARDSTFTLPLVWAAWAHAYLRECAITDSLGRVLHVRSPYAGRIDLLHMDLEVAICRGDQEAAYRLSHELWEAAPASEMWATLAARQALVMNRPRETITILEGLHPDRGALRGHRPYYIWLTTAYHRLGDYERELDAARRARQQYPNDLTMLRRELSALAALGRTREVHERLEELAAMAAHPLGRTPAEVMLWTAAELRLHGFATADSLLEQALRWQLGRPPAEQATEIGQLNVAQTFAFMGRVNEAYPIAERLALDYPGNERYVGLLGVLAAQRGDRRTAEHSERALAEDRGPYSQVNRTYWRACIAAQLGQREQALDLLRQALTEGALGRTLVGYEPHGPPMDIDPFLAPLRQDSAYMRLLKPKG